uniref:Small rubber particle protein SRPP3 n=1 Tax=Taraxacum brevicorniculatum TaxID=1262544 RepID=M9PNQ7_9ASTR|nr:small rubber particle protein SRPP3 [Taraxacum brevicorniculatum]
MTDAASVTEEPEVQSQEEKLKHLDFVEDGVKQAVGYASKAYDYAKDKSGPLKPHVETLESTIKPVVGPAYDKFQDAHTGVHKFVDRKFDEVMPPAVKDATTTARSLSTNVASEVKNNGVLGTAKELLVKIEPLAEEYASSAWKTLNYVPYVTTFAKAVAPTASYYSEKYNETVQQSAEKGYKVSSYVPLVPTDKIARVFCIPEPESAGPGGEAKDKEVPGGGEGGEAAAGGDEIVEET